MHVCVCKREEEENVGVKEKGIPYRVKANMKNVGRGKPFRAKSMEGAWKGEATQAGASLGRAFLARLKTQVTM